MLQVRPVPGPCVHSGIIPGLGVFWMYFSLFRGTRCPRLLLGPAIGLRVTQAGGVPRMHVGLEALLQGKVVRMRRHDARETLF